LPCRQCERPLLDDFLTFTPHSLVPHVTHLGILLHRGLCPISQSSLRCRGVSNSMALSEIRQAKVPPPETSNPRRQHEIPRVGVDRIQSDDPDILGSPSGQDARNGPAAKRLVLMLGIGCIIVPDQASFHKAFRSSHGDAYRQRPLFRTWASGQREGSHETGQTYCCCPSTSPAFFSHSMISMACGQSASHAPHSSQAEARSSSFSQLYRSRAGPRSLYIMASL